MNYKELFLLDVAKLTKPKRHYVVKYLGNEINVNTELLTRAKAFNYIEQLNSRYFVLLEKTYIICYETDNFNDAKKWTIGRNAFEAETGKALSYIVATWQEYTVIVKFFANNKNKLKEPKTMTDYHKIFNYLMADKIKNYIAYDTILQKYLNNKISYYTMNLWLLNSQYATTIKRIIKQDATRVIVSESKKLLENEDFVSDLRKINSK